MTAALQVVGNGTLAERGASPASLATSEPSQYLTFLLEKEMFAIGILAVREIIEYRELTPVPMMPDWLRGVINLRGAVVPVIDLAARFGRSRQPVTKRSCIVIAEVQGESERQVVGVVVDAVSQVLAIASGDIEAPPAFGARIRTDFIEGLAKVAGKFVIILNVDRVLAIDDLSTLDAIDRSSVQSAGSTDQALGQAQTG